MKKNRKRLTPAPAATAAAVPAAAAPVPPRNAFQWRRHLLILVGLWFAALLVYSNSFQAALTYDNGVIIGQDPRIRSLTSANAGQIFNEEYWYPTNGTGLYRPLTTLSYLFNYAVLGNAAKPAGYHWVNFALHATGIALVYFLGLLLLEDIWWATLLAALWSVHPLLTESVTNIVGRADQLAALGVLAGLLCHIRAGQAAGRRKLAWLAGLAVSAAVAVFSKESGVVIVAAMLCYDISFGKSKPWRPRLAGYIAVAAPLGIFFFLRGRLLDHIAMPVTPFVDNPLVDAPLVAGLLTAIKVIGMYLWLFVWPLRLSCDYSYNQIPLFRGSFDWQDIAALLSLALCLAAAFLAIRAWRRGQSLPCFAIAFFFAALAPTANVLVPVGSIMAERWMYLPSLGLALGVVMGLQALERRLPGVPRTALIAGAGVLCLVWGVRTYLRNFDWRDDQILWESAEKVAPESFRPYTMLANLLATAPRPSLDRAVWEAERSAAILDRLSDQQNLARVFAVEGLCYRAKGDSLSDPAQRQDWYRKALAVLLRARRIDVAGRDAANRARMAHGKSASLDGLGTLYLELGHVQRLLGLSQDALQTLNYGRQILTNPEFSTEESEVYRALGDPDRPAVALLEGMFIDPRSQRLADALIQFYRHTVPLTCAVLNKGGHFSFNPECPLVHGHICQAAQNVAATYRDFGKMDKAIATTQAAISGYGCSSSLFQ
jgi:tetratricopeptide (TPR) repeat protein